VDDVSFSDENDELKEEEIDVAEEEEDGDEDDSGEGAEKPSQLARCIIAVNKIVKEKVEQ